MKAAYYHILQTELLFNMTLVVATLCIVIYECFSTIVNTQWIKIHFYMIWGKLDGYGLTFIIYL